MGGEAKSYTVAVTRVEASDAWEQRRDARRFCYAVEDLTAFSQSERQRALMRAAVEHSDVPTLILSPDVDPPGPRILYGNPAAAELTGRSVEALVNVLLTDLDGPGTDADAPARMRQALKETGRYRGESVIHRADGAPLTVEWSVSAVRDEGGAVTHFTAALPDVRERRELERQVLQAQTREQARIARDLHDGVAQQLAGLTMMCGTLKQQAAAGEDVAGVADGIAEAVRDAARDLRGVAHGLMPLDSRRGGLEDGLRRLATITSEITPARCCLQTPDGPVPVGDPEVAHHLYRIAQEAVGNSVRHGRAGAVTLALALDGPDWAVLKITDDGRGFDPAAVAADPDSGMGLAGMRFRAKAIHGRLSFETPAGGGTRVVCGFPHGGGPPDAEPAGGEEKE